MLGVIQFPHSIRTVPAIRIYSCGKKVTFQCDHEAKQLVFQVPQITNHTSCQILITEQVHFVPHTSASNTNCSNTIEYLKVPYQQPYLFYELTLTETKNKQGQVTSSWTIDSRQLDKTTRKIPDEAIIICYDPAYVDTLVGGSTFEIPMIKLKTDLITPSRPEELIQEHSAKMFLSAIHSDTIHAAITTKCQQRTHVTLIAPIA